LPPALFTICSLIFLMILTGPQITARSQNDQNTTLVVNVLDATGAAVSGASVRLDAQGKQQTVEITKQGEARFQRVSPGKYQIHVEARGFEPRDTGEVWLKAGGNRIEVRLEVAAVKAEVEVKRDQRESKTDPRGTAFTTILTGEQIAQLPDDPEEFEAVLRQMAGPGAVIRVNGFSGGKLPPKSQIREIRFHLNSYAAEFHEPGFTAIDILTKPGADAWHVSADFGFRDESLNARNAFAPKRASEQTRRFGFTLDGPLLRRRTSAFFAVDGADAFDAKTIVAELPDGGFAGLIRRPLRRLNLSARMENVLSKTHTLRAEYQRNANMRDNLGAGDFDLPERAYSTTTVENIFRLAETGVAGGRLFNEFRFQALWRSSALTPVSNSAAILILNAVNSGGAQIQNDRRAQDLEIADNLDVALRNHALRGGFLLESSVHKTSELRNARGTFIFASLDDFEAGHPTTFTKREGDPHVKYRQSQFAWYLQDDVRLRPSLTLSFGVRHEMESNINDLNNLAPRLGIAWSPFKNGRTTIRGGGGIFYNWLDAQTLEQTLLVNGQRQREIVVRSPGYPDPFSGGSEIVLPPGRYQLDGALRLPYIAQTSTEIEQQIGRGLRLRATYLYQRGIHEFRGRNINAPASDGVRPMPLTGNIIQVESSANSWYHSLNVSLTSVMSKRLFWFINYSLSKNTNESDGPFGLPANNFDLRSERGPAPGDARHTIVASLNFKLSKSLRIGTFMSAKSATPYNITTGFDDNGDTTINDRPEGLKRNSARGAVEWNVNTRLSWVVGFGNRRAAATSGPRTVRVSSSDLGGISSELGGDNKLRMTLYIQAYNLLNHVNLANFVGAEASPFFRQPTSALPSRRFELGAKLNF
jgi:hypothetical protein